MHVQVLCASGGPCIAGTRSPNYETCVLEQDNPDALPSGCIRRSLRCAVVFVQLVHRQHHHLTRPAGLTEKCSMPFLPSASAGLFALSAASEALFPVKRQARNSEWKNLPGEGGHRNKCRIVRPAQRRDRNQEMKAQRNGEEAGREQNVSSRKQSQTGPGVLLVLNRMRMIKTPFLQDYRHTDVFLSDSNKRCCHNHVSLSEDCTLLCQANDRSTHLFP